MSGKYRKKFKIQGSKFKVQNLPRRRGIKGVEFKGEFFHVSFIQ